MQIRGVFLLGVLLILFSSVTLAVGDCEWYPVLSKSNAKINVIFEDSRGDVYAGLNTGELWKSTDGKVMFEKTYNFNEAIVDIDEMQGNLYVLTNWSVFKKELSRSYWTKVLNLKYYENGVAMTSFKNNFVYVVDKDKELFKILKNDTSIESNNVPAYPFDYFETIWDKIWFSYNDTIVYAFDPTIKWIKTVMPSLGKAKVKNYVDFYKVGQTIFTLQNRASGGCYIYSIKNNGTTWVLLREVADCKEAVKFAMPGLHEIYVFGKFDDNSVKLITSSGSDWEEYGGKIYNLSTAIDFIYTSKKEFFIAGERSAYGKSYVLKCVVPNVAPKIVLSSKFNLKVNTTLTLLPVVTDSNGDEIINTGWLQISGPEILNFNEGENYKVSFTPHKIGTYIIKFFAKDNGLPQLNGSSEITVNVKNCFDNIDCGQGKKCYKDNCITLCNSDDNCFENYECSVEPITIGDMKSNYCIYKESAKSETCVSNADCGQGKKCYNKSCITFCNTKDVCPLNYECNEEIMIKAIRYNYCAPKEIVNEVKPSGGGTGGGTGTSGGSEKNKPYTPVVPVPNMNQTIKNVPGVPGGVEDETSIEYTPEIVKEEDRWRYILLFGIPIIIFIVILFFVLRYFIDKRRSFK